MSRASRALRALTIGFAALLVFTGCQIQPSTSSNPNSGRQPEPTETGSLTEIEYSVGELVESWSEADNSAEDVSQVMEAHPTPLLFSNQEAWDVWVRGLPQALREQGEALEPNFSEEVFVVGSYFDCESFPVVNHHGGGRLEFDVIADEDVDCEWSPRTVSVLSVRYGEIGAEPGGVSLYR